VEPTGPASLAWPGDLDFDPDALIWGGRRRPDRGLVRRTSSGFIAPRRLRPDSQPKRTCGGSPIRALLPCWVQAGGETLPRPDQG
jgi:hypothetical protein